MSTRRKHKKSKLGCQECKRRHIKCDEVKPACLNCSTTERICVYRLPRLHQSRSSSVAHSSLAVSDVSSHPHTLNPPTPASSHVSTPSTLSLLVSSQDLTAPSLAQHGVLYPGLNMRHMELLSNFIMETAPAIGDSTLAYSENSRIMMPVALSAPCLMHQILAISALHLSHKQPARSAFYHEEATTLQIQALTLFDADLSNMGTQNCEAMLLFSSFLGMYALGEAVAISQDDADGFLDRFLSYMNLHRGVRTITDQCWDPLLASSISPILRRAMQRLDSAASRPHERASMVEDLLSRLLNCSDMGENSTPACRDAVKRLKLIYQTDLSGGGAPPQAVQSGSSLWVWPVLLSGTFTELLLKRQPEALIILCYYAVLLHHRRDTWIVGNAGRMLIESTTRSLGSYWRHWLDWPNEVISEVTAT